MTFTLTVEAIALCLSMGFSNCHENDGGVTYFAITQAAIDRGLYDSTDGCPVTRKGSVVEVCQPPDGKSCIVVGRYSMPAYPNGVVYLCRKQGIS